MAIWVRRIIAKSEEARKQGDKETEIDLPQGAKRKARGPGEAREDEREKRRIRTFGQSAGVLHRVKTGRQGSKEATTQGTETIYRGEAEIAENPPRQAQRICHRHAIPETIRGEERRILARRMAATIRAAERQSDRRAWRGGRGCSRPQARQKSIKQRRR